MLYSKNFIKGSIYHVFTVQGLHSTHSMDSFLTSKGI